MQTDKRTLPAYVALAATVILSLLPFFKVGFTTSDDFQYYLTAQTSWANWMADARVYAEGAGRFYFYITKVFYYVPYLVDSFAYTKAVQYVTLVACYALFSYLVWRLFRSRELSLLTMLLLVFDTTITPNNHVATIAYPFYFSFSLILFMGALLLYLSYRERGGYWRIMVSALLVLLCFCFYETYLLFVLVFGIIVVAVHWREKGFVPMCRSKAFWVEVLPFMAAAAVYVGCYFGYRQWLLATVEGKESFYDGAAFSLSTFSVEGFFQVLWRCTREALPGQTYFENQSLLIDNSNYISGHRNLPQQVLLRAPAVVWINALLQGGLLWYLTGCESLRRIGWGRIGVGAAVALAVAFLSHTLIGMATKYNLDWCHWMNGYVTTFYSIFCLMLFMALAVAASLKVCRGRKWQAAARALWCVLLVFFSVLIGYSNTLISREWQKSQNRLEVIDGMAESGFFSTLPDDATLCTWELHNTSWVAYDICKQTMDFEYYIANRAGRAFNFINDPEDLSGIDSTMPLYYLHAIETKKAGELLVSVSRIDGDSTASQADVFFYSPTKKYVVVYQSAGQWKTLPFGADSHTQRLTHVCLRDTAINPKTILVSDMIMP